MQVRRVVVSNGADGKSRVQSDGFAPRAVEYQSLPGHGSALLWSTPASPEVGASVAAADATPEVKFVPGPGETRLLFVTFPPDSAMMRADFDPAAFGAEAMRNAPGLAEKFEMDHPGMHTTDSVDYGVLLDGEIHLELDDGVTKKLAQGDVVVQNGTRHAWRNKTDKAATMLFVLVGAKRE